MAFLHSEILLPINLLPSGKKHANIGAVGIGRPHEEPKLSTLDDLYEAVIRSEAAYLAGELAKTGYLYDTDEEDDGEGPLAGEEEFGD